MDNGFGVFNSAVNPYYKATPPPRFVVELDPAYRVFFRNLTDLLFFRRAPRVSVTSRPAAFWPDVFVASRTPWWPFLESILWHLFAATAVWALAQGWALQQQSLPRTVFNRSDVIYYTPSEYLPPLDTGSSPARVPRKGKPELARQPIISVPPEADNRTQTIITPPNIKLTHDVPVPNIVAWHSANPAVPLSATARSSLPVPSLATPVIAPPPDVNQMDARRSETDLPSAIAPPPAVVTATSRRSIATPQAAVIEPPPAVEASIRRRGDINIGQSPVVAPAPELPMDEQRALSTLEQTLTRAALGGRASQVVPPPPSVQGERGVGYRGVGGVAGASAQVIPPPPSLPGAANTSGSGRLIALGIHPAAGPPPMPVVGNRRGVFSATPEGRRGAPGTPDIAADPRAAGHGGHGNGNGGAGSGTSSKLPPGIVVGPGPKNATTSTVARGPMDPTNDTGAGSGGASSSSNALIADARPMRVTPRRAMTETNAPSAVERQVFGGRRVYSMILNMPNLNSAGGGSWIIRFAELRADEGQGDLTAPEAIHKVDPGYPLELMRQNVQGTVTLYAVIRGDGTVGNVRVLNSPDDRLDPYARAALAGWHFRPAMKNGVAIDLEAVVIIPFRAARSF